MLIFSTDTDDIHDMISGGARGGSGGSLELPFETQLFHFHREF